jgi:hypothetical protein
MFQLSCPTEGIYSSPEQLKYSLECVTEIWKQRGLHLKEQQAHQCQLSEKDLEFQVSLVNEEGYGCRPNSSRPWPRCN